MMLDVNFDKLREHFRSYLPVGATVGALVLLEMALVLIGGGASSGGAARSAAGERGEQHAGARAARCTPTTSIRSRSRP